LQHCPQQADAVQVLFVAKEQGQHKKLSSSETKKSTSKQGAFFIM
jgi:hypothetical protein